LFFKKKKMDVEARKKYCGLLMFPPGPPPSRNNDMSMREVDPSSSTYESSRNMMSNSLDHHQFVMQDGFGEFTNSSSALAAGAAAGGDFINQESLDTPNVIDGDTSASNSKSQPAKRTPRPPNAFILYRRAKQPDIIASQRNLTNAEVSRTISDMWKKEPEETRLEWERYADRKKLEHMQTYPNYVYRPNKNKSKVDKRRHQKRQTASKDSTNSPNNNNNNNNLVENKSATNPGPVRRKSTKSVNSKPPTKLDLPLSMNGMTGFNMQQNTDTSNSYTTILPSPEIPLLSSHFTENPEEFVSHPITPITPLTPPEHDYKVQNHLLQELTYQQQQQQHHHQQQHQHQGNAPQFSFQSIPITSFPNAPNPLEFCCFVPDVEQQQQQMFAEMMLHHEQNHHITPTATVPSSNPASTVPYYSNGGGSFTDMLGFEFPSFLGGSVNHNGNGLDASEQYLQ
jgi:hypothetical protein